MDETRTYKTLKASPMRSQLPQQAGDGYYQHGGEDLREKRHGKCWRLGISSTDDVVGGWGQSKHGRSPSIQLLEVSDTLDVAYNEGAQLFEYWFP